MLSPGDRAVALRDPEVPGLTRLLDDEALGDWLGRRMQTRVEVRSHYLRYKPGTSCVLAAEVQTGSVRQPCLFWAYAGLNDVKIEKSLQAPRARFLLGVDPWHGLVATTPAADRALPGLRRLLDGEQRVHLLRHLLPDHDHATDATVQVLRHKPGRRWVGMLQPRSGPPLVLRVYPPDVACSARDTIAAWGAGRPRTPRLVGAHLRRGVVAVDYVSGRVLSAQGDDADGYRSAGAALARLHSRSDVPLRRDGLAADARGVQTAARYLSMLWPDLAGQAQQLAHALTACFAGMEDVWTPIHGDFSSDQVVAGDDGETAVIDLDAARLGDPAADLACMAAALTCDVVLGGVPATRAEALLDELHAGYASERTLPDPHRLAVQEAGHLLRRAGEAFRLRRCEDWPAATAEVLARASRVLATPTKGRVR